MSRRTADDVARRAEPKGVGSARARDPGALLGQVIIEQEGPELFEIVEHLRRAAIRRRSGADDEASDATRRAIEDRPATVRLVPQIISTLT